MPDALGIPQLTALFAIALVVGALELGRRAARDARIHHRLFADEPDALEELDEALATPRDRALGRWLVRAGHRGPRAEATFLAASFGAVLLAALLVWGLRTSGAAAALAAVFAGLPVVGPGLAGVLSASPWLLGLAVAALPTLLVRRDRARRVEEIEQDLPLVLELLATLAEAGLGFESAVDELLRAQPAGRPLADELRLYQLEVSTGARRAESLRSLSSRVDLPSVSSFTSALAHGEETGSSIAGLLRPQALLVRQR
ncbi:MAG: hypothetical protein AAGC67_20785, partial [Myxococcota bacterium]